MLLVICNSCRKRMEGVQELRQHLKLKHKGLYKAFSVKRISDERLVDVLSRYEGFLFSHGV